MMRGEMPGFRIYFGSGHFPVFFQFVLDQMSFKTFILCPLPTGLQPLPRCWLTTTSCAAKRYTSFVKI